MSNAKPNQSIENRPLVISIISMIGMVTAIATGAFMLGQYQATINNRLAQTDLRVERLETTVESHTQRLNEGDVSNTAFESHVTSEIRYIRELLEELRERRP